MSDSGILTVTLSVLMGGPLIAGVFLEFVWPRIHRKIIQSREKTLREEAAKPEERCAIGGKHAWGEWTLVGDTVLPLVIEKTHGMVGGYSSVTEKVTVPTQQRVCDFCKEIQLKKVIEL